jgi:hypothetical protein
MNESKKLRLLNMAKDANGDHERFYSSYYDLMKEGLVSWKFGFASLTPKGQQYLDDTTN